MLRFKLIYVCKSCLRPSSYRKVHNWNISLPGQGFFYGSLIISAHGSQSKIDFVIQTDWLLTKLYIIYELLLDPFGDICSGHDPLVRVMLAIFWAATKYVCWHSAFPYNTCVRNYDNLPHPRSVTKALVLCTVAFTVLARPVTVTTWILKLPGSFEIHWVRQ